MPVRPSVSLVALLATTVLSSACATEEPTLDEESAALSDSCSTGGCGANSPVIRGVPFYDLNRLGQRNDQGISITGFRGPPAPPFNGRPLSIDVVGAQLIGRDLRTNAVVLSGTAVQGSILNLATPNGPYEIHVVGVDSMAYWAGVSGTVTTYELKVRRSGSQDELQRLCSHPPGGPGSETFEDWPNGNPLHALLFTGDRYLPESKQVRTLASDPVFVSNWFNIACAGSATAKLHLMRHTTAGADPRPLYQTTVKQRQTMLRMYTSALCPSGYAYTYAGERLRYKDTGRGLVNVWTDVNTVEAVWTADGATCLDVHRLVDATFPDQTAADKLLDRLMTQDCGPTLPMCSSIPGFDRNRPSTWPRSASGAEAYLLSANPFGS